MAHEDLAEKAVDTINAISGRYEGHRAAHARGRLMSGTFTAAPEAAALTTAPHLQGDTVRTTVRFSNGGGNPEIPDYAREGRGMAVKFYLPDGSTTDIVALNQPCFFARTPEDFVEFTTLRRPLPETGQPDMEKLGAWLGAHPEAQIAIGAAMSTPPPASYAQSAYNSIHAFRMTNAEGVQRYVRYRWEPEAGVASLEADDAKARGRNYLQEEIVARGPFAFRLYAILAEDSDDVDDATVPWPEDRTRVQLGTLAVTGPETEREADPSDVLVMDPTRTCPGIECSDDPILNFRHHAYAVSVHRRSGVKLGA